MTISKDCLVGTAGAATCESSKPARPPRVAPAVDASAGTAGNDLRRMKPPQPPTRGPEPNPTLPSHSILIPHRGRQKYLDLCLKSLHRSAGVCGSPEYETIVLEPTEDDIVFNKCALYNLGIAEARGDVISFLDADMLVGPRWMEGVAKLAEDPRIVRLCYRVRRLSRGRTEQLFKGPGFFPTLCYLPDGPVEDQAAFISAMFGLYDHFELAAEAYREPDRCRPGEAIGWAHEVYGNSQFSITREKLADIRYDERYEGKGREDWEIARQMQRRYGADYRGFIWTDAEHALFHMWHDQAADDELWSNAKYAKRQFQLWEEDK